MNTLGQILRETRQQRGLSLQWVALEAGSTETHISRVERGVSRGTIDLLLRLSRALGLPDDVALAALHADCLAEIDEAWQLAAARVEATPIAPSSIQVVHHDRTAYMRRYRKQHREQLAAYARQRYVRGSFKGPRRAFTPEQIKIIRDQFAAGRTIREMALAWGASSTTMSEIRAGYRYYQPEYGADGVVPAKNIRTAAPIQRAETVEP
jgi:transcriptional regulator with XRE-family HTH domain